MHCFQNQDEMDRAACDWVLENGLKGRHPAWILPTGSSPEGMYRALCNACLQGHADLGNVVFFNLDEYVGLPLHHPQSYHTYMRQHLYDAIRPDPGHVHIPEGTADNLPEACRAYDALLDAAGNPTIAVLGVGDNGHIGFNEPGTDPGLRTHIQHLSETTRRANQRFFAHEDTPAQAITMGIADILKADRILLLVNSAGKAAVVQQAMEQPPDINYPVSWLQHHQDVTILAFPG